jgi:hypothetical protein
MSTTPMHSVTLKWTGKKWEVSGLPEAMKVRRNVVCQVSLAEQDLEPADAEKEIRVLFPKDTVLYLPLNPSKDELRLRQLCHLKKPILRSSADRDLLPIMLDEDLRIGIRSRSLLDTACHFAGDETQTFRSLNDAAQTALKTWTNRRTASIGVFKEVQFVHDAELLMIDIKRDEILYGKPLPKPGPAIVIRDLFDDQAPA